MNFQSITVHCTNLTETETNWSAAAAGSHMKHAPAQLITAQPQLDLLLEGTRPSLAAIGPLHSLEQITPHVGMGEAIKP